MDNNVKKTQKGEDRGGKRLQSAAAEPKHSTEAKTTVMEKPQRVADPEAQSLLQRWYQAGRKELRHVRRRWYRIRCDRRSEDC